jgi:hypothetical protein
MWGVPRGPLAAAQAPLGSTYRDVLASLRTSTVQASHHADFLTSSVHVDNTPPRAGWHPRGKVTATAAIRGPGATAPAIDA